MELLRLKERIEIATELGESHFREFKSGFEGLPENKTNRPVKDICQNISKTLVAFANADGGELLVGVEDDGVITGLFHNDKQIKAILNAPKTHVLSTTPVPTTKATIVEIKGLKVAYFSIPKGTEFVHLTSEGKCLKRRDLESVPVSPESIQFERNEKTSREYDRNFIDEAGITSLDIDLVKSTAHEFSKTISPEKYLQHLDLAEFDGTKLKLRKAALLLFAKHPHRWHPRNQVRVLKIAGTELKSGKDFNVVKDEEVSDNILNLIEKSWDLLRPHLTETVFSDNAIFKSQIIYPELACREALTNAIAHRDYSIEGRGIEIFIFTDRLEIKSPGMLLSSIKISDLEALKGVHQSRNVNIARILREVGYMRELGEGLRRIYELMENSDLTKPSLKSKNKSFSVSLFQKLVYTSEEMYWLENFTSLELSRNEKTIVRLGAKGELISPNMIWSAVGIVDTDIYRQLLESLRKKGILISEISKPEAIKKARKERIKDKKSIPRFRIIHSKINHDISNSSKKNIKVNTLRKKTVSKFDNSDYEKLYIENLPYDINEEDLQNLFSKYGVIESIKIPVNYETNSGKGYAFIEFEKKEDVDDVLKDKYNIYLKNRKVIIKRYWKKNKPVLNKTHK